MGQNPTERTAAYVKAIAQRYGGIDTVLEQFKSKLAAPHAEGLEGMGAPGNVKGAAAAKAMQDIARDRVPDTGGINALEALIIPELRPAIRVKKDKFTVDHPLWIPVFTPDVTKRICDRLPSIGRVELPGHPWLPYGGTGFVVGDGLIMTNRHVAEIFGKGLGTRALAFRSGMHAGIDFVRDGSTADGPTFNVTRVVMIHPYWDMALLAVEGLGGVKPLQLSVMDAYDLAQRKIAVVGYPSYDPRNDAGEQQDLFGNVYGVKRLQPGELGKGTATESFEKQVKAATHDCSTLCGNSGSAVLDLETGDVLALHFGGVYHDTNYGVPAFQLAKDQRVVDAGVRFAGTTGGSNTWGAWWRRADSGSPEAALAPDGDGPAAPARPASPPVVAPQAASVDGDAIDVEVPIRIRISVGDHRVLGAASAIAPQPAPPGAADVQEAMREPWHEANYGSRKGYQSNFLNARGSKPLDVPMPTAKVPSALAKTRSGGTELKYQNFSICMHAKRRLALIAASNVTKEARLRNPEDGRDYTRKGLSGLGPNDTEKWYIDDRLDPKYQLPDVFFNKDRKAFDKGHIVRREDVAWGKTYDELRRGNGDSYHVTNCSPQVAPFNQSARGEDNWGDLENVVLKEARTERLCVFAGPVLDDRDRVFHGVGDGGVPILARIPLRFWKVVVARVDNKLAAFGFVLEQDLSDVAFEFVVPPEFVPYMYPLKEIETMTGVVFHKDILKADQYGTNEGALLSRHAGIKRRK